MLLEEANHAAATGTAIQPHNERRRHRIFSGFEQPEPDMLRTLEMARPQNSEEFLTVSPKEI